MSDIAELIEQEFTSFRKTGAIDHSMAVMEIDSLLHSVANSILAARDLLHGVGGYRGLSAVDQIHAVLTGAVATLGKVGEPLNAIEHELERVLVPLQAAPAASGS